MCLIESEVIARGNGTAGMYFATLNYPPKPGTVFIYATDEHGETVSAFDKGRGKLHPSVGEVNYKTGDISFSFIGNIPKSEHIVADYETTVVV